MPKAKSSQQTRRVRNHAVVSHTDEPYKDKCGCDITVLRTATERIIYSTTLTSKLETGTSINSDFADPWTTGFFASNTEAFVVDLPPVWAPDGFLDSDLLKPQLEPKERHMVWMSFIFECLHIDKDSWIRLSRYSKPGKCMIVLCISMSYSAMMVELANPCAHSVEIATPFTSARNVSAVTSIVRHVSLNNTYLILYIKLRCVVLHMCQGINLIYLQKWNGFFFVQTSLCDLRLVVHLGHQGLPCSFIGRILDRFMVVHMNGIHTVKVRFCTCHGKGLQPKF